MSDLPLPILLMQ